MTDCLAHEVTASSATADELSFYMEGACHHLAIALNRHLGWPMEVHLDVGNLYWQDEADPENFIPSVLHVYAIDPAGQLWDIRGVRSQNDVSEDIDTLYSPDEHDSEEIRGEHELRSYVGYWSDDVTEQGEPGEPIDRPLDSYTDEDIEAAWRLAQRVLGLIVPPAPTAPTAKTASKRRRLGS
jgi:hypothetical protein